MLTEELPIYTKVLELVKLTRQFLMNMNRIDRIWYGEMLIKNELSMIESISLANRSQSERYLYINRMLAHFEAAKAILRLLNEARSIPTSKMLTLTRLVTSIERQANGWKGCSRR